MVLDLVCCRGDGRLCEQLLEVLDRIVRDAYGLDFVRVGLDQLLEILPRVDVGDAAINVTGTVVELGKEGVVSWTQLVVKLAKSRRTIPTVGAHRNGPVHQVQVDIGCLEQFQALL